MKMASTTIVRNVVSTLSGVISGAVTQSSYLLTNSNERLQSVLTSFLLFLLLLEKSIVASFGHN